MGKPYVTELQQLEETYTTVMDMDMSALRKSVRSSAPLPLFTIGSGGSLSAANIVAFYHQLFARQFAKAVTPLEAVEFIPDGRRKALWFISAGGTNTDINNAFQRIVLQEPEHLLIFCAKTGSRLSRIANQYEYPDIFEFNLPSKKDGFLATNSLLAFTLLAAQAYQEYTGMKRMFPQNMWDLLKHKGTPESFLPVLRNRCAHLWEREHLIVLFGPTTHPAAFDLESKFTEAALGPISLADYRNFAHGRHQWLAKRGDTSAVLSFTTSRDKGLADKTISLIPTNIPVVQLHFEGNDTHASIAALVTALHIVALAGEAKNIDPGRPNVPAFGRKIYHLRGISTKTQDAVKGRDFIAVRRKASVLSQTVNEECPDYLLQAYKKFVRSLSKQSFEGIVFDYDGTLCSKENRYGDLTNNISKELTKILKAGIPVGIATGRGKSVRTSLQKALSKSLWQRIIIGYYNGAACGLLSEDSIPDGSNRPCSDLESISKIILNHPALQNYCGITVRKFQLTIEALPPLRLEQLLPVVFGITKQYGTPEIKVVSSSHSIDILAPTVSKLSVLTAMYSHYFKGTETPILCIGDRGLWPGNDYELLQTKYSLSVDEVSIDSNTCWNIAPAGFRGVQATLSYLDCIDILHDKFHYRINPPRRQKK